MLTTADGLKTLERIKNQTCPVWLPYGNLPDDYFTLSRWTEIHQNACQYRRDGNFSSKKALSPLYGRGWCEAQAPTPRYVYLDLKIEWHERFFGATEKALKESLIAKLQSLPILLDGEWG